MTSAPSGPDAEASRATPVLDESPSGRTAQFVVKISKYCNLRCAYCYEYAHLADKRRMSLESIERILESIAAGASALGFSRVEMIWHGGEPFLIPLDDYDEIARLEERILAPEIPYSNTIQTNLTVLTGAHMTWLEAGRFTDTIGVSFDAGGPHRVDTGGRNSVGRTLANMQRLLDRGIPFGAICVLTRDTVARAASCYRFFDQAGLACRLLPFYRAASVPEAAAHALGHDELVAAMCSVFDAWRTSETATPVEPIDEYLGFAIRYIMKADPYVFDPREGDGVFIVNTDGETWGHCDAYEPGGAHGNLFRDPLDALWRSPARQARALTARAAMERHCGRCEFHGACSGYPVAESTSDQLQLIDARGCPARAILAHMVAELERSKLPDEWRAGGKRAASRPHLIPA